MPIDEQKQYKYFNIHDHQYDPNLILQPPLHTVYETDVILNKVKEHMKEEGGAVADFGAGSGRITIPLLKNGYSVYSIDISEKSLANLSTVCKKEALPEPTLLRNLPENMKFKAIVGADILHHVDFDEYFPKLYEALEPGGKIIFSEPNAFNLAWYIYLPLVADWDVEKGMMECSIFNFTKKLKKAGFKDIKLEGLGLFPRSLLSFSSAVCRFNDMLGNFPLLKLFAYRYIVQATK